MAVVQKDLLWLGADLSNIKECGIAGDEMMDNARKDEDIRFRQILDLAPAVIYLKDRQGRYSFVNRHFELLSGYTAEQVLGKTDFDLFPEEVAKNSLCNDQKVLESGKPLEFEEFGPVDGALHTFISAKFPIYDAEGQIVELCGISTDIQARKEAERHLKESEERFRVALEANPDPVLLLDRRLRVVYCNPAFTRVFGWTREESIDRRLDDFIPERERNGVSILIQKIGSGKTLPAVETHHLTKENHQVSVEITGGVYSDAGGAPVGCILNIRDISEQKRLQRQIRQAHRLESLGRLAGGIAHNFNNLLMGIQGSVELIKMDCNSVDPADSNLLNITQCVNSGAELTNQLLGMARGGKYAPEPLDVNEIIRYCLEDVSRNASQIQMNWNLEKSVWEIEADRVQIRMVLSSLFDNARQAMSQGGCLFVSSENVELNEEAILHNLEPGRFVKISISDSGCELDSNALEHIFDPFYATLSATTGEGLGLAAAYGITRNHGGVITIESIHGKGNTFHIYLPAVAAQCPVPEEEPILHKMKSQTVLLVDDEKIVAQVGAAMLERMGYEVLVAYDAEAALGVFEKNRDSVGIVLLDMVMPGMGGKEAYLKFKAIDPHLKILLCSGYSIHGEASRIMELGCDGFIQKPFNINDLSAKILEIVGEA
jgi:two-component system cell cycle sensor histidine kinase/response regulator CckA